MRTVVTRVGQMAGLLVAVLLLTGVEQGGCGGLFSQDKDSAEAKRIDGRFALDKGKCDEALVTLQAVYDANPTSAEAAIDLSGAFLCRAGFNINAFLKVAAEAGGTAGFDTILNDAVGIIPATSSADTSAGAAVLAPFAEKDAQGNAKNADAAFQLGILNMGRVALVAAKVIKVADALLDPTSDCATDPTTCKITQEDAELILGTLTDDGLLDAAVDALTASGVPVDSDVLDQVKDIKADIELLEQPGDTKVDTFCRYLADNNVVALADCAA